MLPIDLVVVRHGQSEGNAAKRLSEAGDNRAFTQAFRERHSSSLRLTPKGVDQAKRAGRWIFQNLDSFGVGEDFGRYYVSEYVRAKETAAHLDIPGARWYTDPYLRERDWGDLDICPEDERKERFGTELRVRNNEPFFWKAPNGESLADMCLRLDRVLDTLHRECSNKRVLMVCHGEVMWGLRMRIERIPQKRFRDLLFSQDSYDRIYNCQIMHYTRRDPDDGTEHPYVGWMRMIRPVESKPWVSDWQRIERPTYSNEELLDSIDHIKAMVA